MSNHETAFVRREVAADLVESTPGRGALGHWLLASPLLLYLAWLWVDFFNLFSPLPWVAVNVVVGALIYIAAIVLPLGYGAHRCVLALPRLFQNAGWDVEPLEAVKPAELYSVRYRFGQRHWAASSWDRLWLRAAQGWVFLEIAVILLGAVVMIPLFFSASEFGFGR